MLKEVIILAGGFGTRLRSVIAGIPKPMADISGKPFLHYLLSHVQKAGAEKVILSVGYKAEIIEAHFGRNYLGMEIIYAFENEPLGTGGGIRLAMEKCEGENVLTMNGDSFFGISLNALSEFHAQHNADATLALRKVSDASRYGTIETGTGSRILSFREKNPAVTGEALINAGVYLLRRELFLGKTRGGKAFSIENDFFAPNAATLRFYGMKSDDYFIDIGIPEDYERAKKEFVQLYS
ncbi:MAG TPA: nucleotidyltransferase family protein [Bacteroidia bacterium]|nr:nucleotidyltransferase family protein [Bacteroidia bacterium]